FCSPSVLSCSTAAGRIMSAAISIGLRPRFWRYLPSFAVVVVFPAPWRPAIMRIVGPPWAGGIAWSTDPMSADSSLWTIEMNIWVGLTVLSTSAPSAAVFTFSMKSLTILKLTSAARRARRTSWSPSSTLDSVSFPLPESFRKTLVRDSLRDSNMGRPFYSSDGGAANSISGMGNESTQRRLQPIDDYRGMDCADRRLRRHPGDQRRDLGLDAAP